MKEKEFPIFKTKDGQVFHPDDQGQYLAHPGGSMSLVEFTRWAKKQRLDLIIKGR